MQNSQRVHDAKPRTAAVSHRGRCGAAARWGHRALPQRDRTTRHGRCARRWGARGAGCQASAPRWRAATGKGAAARGKPPWAVAGKHRALPQRDRTMEHDHGTHHGARARRAEGARRGDGGALRQRSFNRLIDLFPQRQQEMLRFGIFFECDIAAGGFFYQFLDIFAAI